MGVPYETGLKQSTSFVTLHVAYAFINDGVERQGGCPKAVPRLFMFHLIGTQISQV